jgi:hypothetical protein
VSDGQWNPPLWPRDTVSVFYLIDGVTLNFFAKWQWVSPGNGRLYLRCRVINWRFSPCNKVLRELLSFLDVTCHIHESHTTSWVIVCAVLWHVACSDVFLSSGWSPPMLYALTSEVSSSEAISASLIYLPCLIRPSELNTFSSRVDVFGRPGGCLSSSSTLPYSETTASFPRLFP